MRKLIAIATLLLAASLHAEATKQYVSLDGTRLLSKPAAFAKANATLKKGTVVWADAAKNGYMKVKVDATEATGYLNVRALQASKPKLTASAKRSGDASAEEVAAATKGFNKQVEADLRNDGKNEGGYDKLDKLITRSKVEDPQGGLEGFREKGQLGEYKKGGE
jgi:hypothetical protein